MTGVAMAPVAISEKRISRTIVNVQRHVNAVPSHVESDSQLEVVSEHPTSSDVTTIYAADTDVRPSVVESDDDNAEMFRSFASAVMAKHQPLKNYGSGMTVCSCGQPEVLCDYTMLANEYLSSPTTVRRVVD